MTPEIIRQFRSKVAKEVRVESEGIDRFIVFSPFAFDDGDGFVIVLKKEGAGWVLTDEGHTFLHLSYDDVDLSSGTRAKIIEQILSEYKVRNDEGELRLEIPDSSYGDALFTYVQALSQVSSISRWTREKVRITFREDFAKLVESSVPIGRALAGYRDPKIDPKEAYPIDYAIISATTSKPYFVFGIASDGQCQQATITCLHYERHGFKFGSVAIYEDQADIGRRAVAQLSDVVDKQFSSLANRERIQEYLDAISRNGH